MKCPNCQEENATGSRFCQFCGSKMVASAAADLPVQPPIVKFQHTTTQPVREHPSPAPNPYRPAPPSRSTSTTGQIGQIGTGGTSGMDIWGPFAGYGARGRHVSWLLDDLGQKAEALHQAMTKRFRRRQIPGSNMGWVALTAKGLLVERRPFYFVERGITTVALYIARFGQDLYISQVTYVKGPISNVRVAILGLMLLFSLYCVTLYPSAVSARLSAYGSSFGLFGSGTAALPFFLLCVLGPLGVLNNMALFLVFIYSVYKWIGEKDFLAILRTPPNEFEKDDTIALEKAVEETVRQSLDAVGIDPKLMPAVPEYGLQRRLI